MARPATAASDWLSSSDSMAGADDHEVDAVAGQCGKVHLRGEPTGLGVHGCGEHTQRQFGQIGHGAGVGHHRRDHCELVALAPRLPGGR
jgi:hypothetical protein